MTIVNELIDSAMDYNRMADDIAHTGGPTPQTLAAATHLDNIAEAYWNAVERWREVEEADNRRLCPDCGVMTSNADHECIVYDESVPCETCGAGTVFVFIAAPGTGSGHHCANGHYHGTCRELTLDDVR